MNEKQNGPIFVVRNVDGVAVVDVHAQDCENPPTAEQVEAIRSAAQAEINAMPSVFSDRRPVDRAFVEEVVGRVLGRKTATYDPPPYRSATRIGDGWAFRNKLRDEKAKRRRQRRKNRKK